MKRSKFSEEQLTITEFLMDGRGACRDNIFVKRLWRSVKYEEVYMQA